MEVAILGRGLPKSAVESLTNQYCLLQVSALANAGGIGGMVNP